MNHDNDDSCAEGSMNEDEWLNGADVTELLTFLKGRCSDRKLRLFAVACCQRIWGLLQREDAKELILTAERHADGLVSRNAMRAARRVYDGVVSPQGFVALTASSAARTTVEERATQAAILTAVHVGEAVVYADPNVVISGAAIASACATLIPMLRDILGNPFRPVTVDAAWLARNDGAVSRIAQAIYDDSAFDQLPILADALEDSGCTDDVILAHLRSSGPHVRGCWALDLLLGKR
jgi:hypothetical protein